MDPAFNFSLRRDRLYEQVADRLQELIVDESLRPGDRLPSERDLAERLAVSRTVIREAIRVLGVRGLVEVKPGSGTYVQELSLSDAAAPIGLLLNMRHSPDRYNSLYEVRRTLEVEIAGLAAERATDEDIEAMEAALKRMVECTGDAEQFTHCDLGFHAALAAATQNDLYSVLLTPITDLLLEFRLTAYRYDPQGSVEGALTHHPEIMERVKARDAEGARQAMRDHLRQAEGLMEDARKHAEGS